MVFQANKWGWKALAARLLLAPVLAGSLAAPAFAQTGSKGQATAATQSGDPKEMLKAARKALAEGRYDAATELARAAATNNPSGRWGLFGDTPDALLKDAQAVRAKADKAAGVVLAKEAKELYSKAARTDAERLANLDAAATKMEQALTLTGGSDWLDGVNPFADKPEAMKREIDAARAKLRRAMPDTPAVNARGTTPAGVTGARLANATPAARQVRFDPEQAPLPLPGGTTAEKSKAMEMMKAGRGLMAEGKLTEARAAFVAAAKQGGVFAQTEDYPDKCLQEVAEKGKAKVDGLVAEAQKCAAAKDYAKAEAALASAKEVAGSLDLWTRGIDLELDAVRKLATGGTQLASADLPGLPVVADTPAPKAETPKAAPLPDIPLVDGPTVTVPLETPKTIPAKPAAKPEADTLPAMPVLAEPKPQPVAIKPVESKASLGKKMLDQATTEMKRGELEMARKLAVEVHNGDFGMKDEAQKLMVAIDAEAKAAKAKEASASLDAAAQAFNAKQYDHADKLLGMIDVAALPADQQTKHEVMAKATAAEIAKLKAPAATSTAKTTPAPAPSGLIPSTPTAGSGTLEAAKTLAETELQQLRSEGLQAQAKSIKLFGQGDTDQAVLMLTDFITKVKASKQSAARQKLLLDPVEAKLENFRLIKRQVDLTTKDVKDKKDRMENRLAKASAEQQKQDEIAKRVRQAKELSEKKQFAEAEKVILQAKLLDPDNDQLALLHQIMKNNRRADEVRQLKDDKELLVYNGLNKAEQPGPMVDVDDPVSVNVARMLRNSRRPSADDQFARPRTAIEREIELKLERPMTIELKSASLKEVIEKFADVSQVNMVTDEPAIASEGVDLDKVTVSEKIGHPISLRNIMQVILDKHRLQYVIENDVVQITTQKKAKGRMYTKVYSVTDLVTPVPDFALPESASLDKTFQRLATPQQPWVNATAAANAAMGGGTLVSGGPAGGWAGNGPATGGRLENVGQPGGPQGSPLAPSAFLAPTKANHSEQLMRLIKGMVRPHTWDEGGGAGKLAYYDIGGALVVNQTADVIREVNDLLESLRRLQDLSVSVEIRIISLSESFFERIGVDFQMNIKTNKSTEKFEQGLTTASFRPAPFVNDISSNNVVTGWNPATGFTSDLDVPIRPNTYGFSVPPFGGYPGNGNGGLNLGLAFLNDIQVFMFLEAAAGDRRANVMQAPKLTLFNGQTSTVSVNESFFFVTGLQVLNVGGQFVYQPINTPFPVGANVTVQAIVSSDRRFVRLQVAPILTELTSATVPLFPVTAFITPVFEGGSQGTPIPFTQFFQQPSFSTVNIQSTVVCPDGGTVLLGGMKQMSEGRNEFGPPVLSNIPYLNRLFRNTGIGRETRHLMLMVTPRIIITSEEEQVQTQEAQNLGTGN